MQPLRTTPIITAAAWTPEQRAEAMRESLEHQQQLLTKARQTLEAGVPAASRQAMTDYRAEHTAYQWLARVQLNNTTTSTGN